jgi:hypothetical protein
MCARHTEETLMKKRFLVGVLVIIALLASCSANKGATGSKVLIGTWEGSDGSTWSFTGNKLTESIRRGVKKTVPYKVKGNSIFTEDQGVEIEMEFEIDEDILTVSIMGFDMEFERVK